MLRLSTLALMITTLSAVVVQASSSSGTDHSSACNSFPYDNPSVSPLPSSGTCPGNSTQSTGLNGIVCLSNITGSSALFTTSPQSDCAQWGIDNNSSYNIYCDLDSGFGTCWRGETSTSGWFWFTDCQKSWFPTEIGTNTNELWWISDNSSGDEWELCSTAFSSSTTTS